MSLYDKAIKNVAEAAARIMIEKLHPNQQKLDVHEPEKDKLTAHDFKKLRSMKKEETEQLDEISTKTLAKAASAASDPGRHYDDDEKYHDPQKFADHAKKTKDAKSAAAVQGAADAKGHYPRPGHSVGVYDKLAYRAPARVTADGKANKQDVKTLKKNIRNEEVDEAVESPFTSYKKPRPIESKGGSGVKKGTAYGGSAQKSKPEQETAEEKPMKPKKKKLSEMVALYNEKGLKSLEEMTKVELSEEPDNEQFTKELEDQKNSMMGKKKQPSVSAPATQGVKTMPEDYEVLDANEINGVKIDNIQERSLSEPEMKKKEEIVKGMKKGLQGFKDRYGDRAKEVMYATATKQAKGE